MPVGNALVAAFLEVTYALLDFLWWVLIIGAVLSWLVTFGIVNPYNRFINVLGDMISRITEPLLAPIRRLMPATGSIDLSPLILMFAIYFLQMFIRNLGV